MDLLNVLKDKFVFVLQLLSMPVGHIWISWNKKIVCDSINQFRTNY